MPSKDNILKKDQGWDTACIAKYLPKNKYKFPNKIQNIWWTIPFEYIQNDKDQTQTNSNLDLSIESSCPSVIHS